jgi:hypothetical protein
MYPKPLGRFLPHHAFDFGVDLGGQRENICIMVTATFECQRRVVLHVKSRSTCPAKRDWD